MLYHIPCENDASARATFNALREMGLHYEIMYTAPSYHPAATAYVVIDLQEGEDAEPIVARGGYPVTSDAPTIPLTLTSFVDLAPGEQQEEEDEVEEETVPDDEQEPEPR